MSAAIPPTGNPLSAATEPQKFIARLQRSLADGSFGKLMLGRPLGADPTLQKLLAPVGFNWQIAIALVPGMAAREVAVGALGTVYALSATGPDVASQLGVLIGQSWSLATALSLLAWYVFAPQCISTLVAVRRETNSWTYPMMMAAYLFALAYAASFITYRLALMGGGG